MGCYTTTMAGIAYIGMILLTMIGMIGVIEYYDIESFESAVCHDPREFDILPTLYSHRLTLKVTVNGETVQLRHPAQYTPIRYISKSQLLDTLESIRLEDSVHCITNGRDAFFRQVDDIVYLWVMMFTGAIGITLFTIFMFKKPTINDDEDEDEDIPLESIDEDV